MKYYGPRRLTDVKQIRLTERTGVVIIMDRMHLSHQKGITDRDQTMAHMGMLTQTHQIRRKINYRE